MLDFFALLGNTERKMLLTVFSSGWPPCMELCIHALPAPVAPLCYLICKYPPFNRDIRSSSSVRMVFSILCQEADCVVITRQHLIVSNAWTRPTVMHAKYTRQWSNNGARILVACPQYDCERQALTSSLVPIRNRHSVRKCYWTIDHTYQ